MTLHKLMRDSVGDYDGSTHKHFNRSQKHVLFGSVWYQKTVDLNTESILFSDKMARIYLALSSDFYFCTGSVLKE